MDYETDSSSFETSELLADFLVSTPLLGDSWRLCDLANVSAPRGFLTEVIGEIGYLAFSGVQVVSGADPSWCLPVALESAAEGLFPSLKCHSEEDEEEKPVRIHSGFLRLFLDFYESEQFQAKIAALLERNKLIVITGYSIGATVASVTALWLLNRTISSSSTSSILCISYGSPLLGNDSLSLAVLEERWGGNFCHVVFRHDLIPRLLFAPPNTEHLHSFLHLLQLQSVSDAEITELFKRVLSAQELAATEAEEEWSKKTSYWPFGTYVFCSEEGAICLENVASIVKMLHLLCSTNYPRRSVEDHFKYRDYIEKLHLGFLKRREFKGADIEKGLSESSFEAGVSLALESSGIDQQETILKPARDLLEMANRNGCQRNLNVARLAIKLSRINPVRAQIEWYQERCDQSDDQLGYYDTFKKMRANKREHAVNMHRLTLARFWDSVITMWERNELPYDFHTRSKWIYGSQMYKLRLEPLDIADYYRSNKHIEKGHYIEHGRERRYRVFDRWWRSRKARDNNRRRSKFATLTQDSLFWARVEEANDWVERVKIENDTDKLKLILERIDEFEKYAAKLIERKEVSKDVLFKNSSFSVWVEQWKMLKVQLQQHSQLHFAG